MDGKLRGEGLLAPFARRRIDCAAAFVRERSARSQAVDAHILESFLNPGRRKVLVDAPFDRVGGREVVCPGALAREHLEGDGDVEDHERRANCAEDPNGRAFPIHSLRDAVDQRHGAMRPSEPESAPQKGEPQVQASAEAAGEMACSPMRRRRRESP